MTPIGAAKADSGPAVPSDPSSLAARVAVLEERTRDRPKSALDRVKEWGGIVSLVIAVAYSFPMGLWDRFIVSEKERTAREISRLRGVVAESAGIVADAGRALSGMSDPYFRDQVARAFNTKLHLLMAANEGAFAAHQDALTPQELVIVAYNYQMVDRIDRTVALYDAALAKTTDNDGLRAEIQRLKGQALFYPSPYQNLALARTTFATARQTAAAIRGFPGIKGRISVLSDWGRAELTAGDWQCGRTLLGEAMDLLQQHGVALGDRGMTHGLLMHQFTTTLQQPGQPAQGCGS